jgi:hypothetical protein
MTVAIALVTTTSHAQPKPPATKPGGTAKPAAPPAPVGPRSISESLTGEAKADYEAAKLLHSDGDFAGALVKFLAAYDKSKDPRLLWNVAACEKSLRHYSSALVYVRRYLAEGKAVLSEADVAEAEALLKAIEPLTAVIDLSVDQQGARVFLDDKPIGETPLTGPILVDLGTRKLRVEKDGFEPYREELTIGDSPRIKLVAKLEKSSSDATLTVYTARPLDQIFLDGALRGEGTWRGAIPSGDHTLRVAAPEMRTWESQISLRDRETKTVAMTLDREESKPSGRVPTWMWIGGAALVVTGVVIAGIVLLQPEDRPADLPVGTLDPGTVQASFPGALLR